MIREHMEATATYLRAIAYFSDITILTTAGADLAKKITQAIQSKLGRVVVIEPLPGRPGYAGDTVSLTLGQAITVFEAPLFNRAGAGTHKTAEDIVVQLMLALRPKRTPAAPCYVTEYRLVASIDSALQYTVTTTSGLKTVEDKP